jgi:hypothetical protein
MNEATDVLQPFLGGTLRRLEVMRCVDPQSPQHGSMDREFWNYRTTRGFSSAPLQHAMGAYALASVMTTDFEQATFASTAEHLATFWVGTRNTNGSANEWFRNEQSYCATAMGLHALTETATVLRATSWFGRLQPLLGAAASSARWLQRRSNPLAMNQDVASVSARWSLGTLLGDTTLCESSAHDLGNVLKVAEKHGHLLESGGFDIGYTLLTLDLLVAAHMNGLESTKNLAEILCDRLIGVVSRSGDFPFVLGSRGTSHRFFGGLHYFARSADLAAHLVSRLREDHLEQQAVHSQEYDDRYLATFASTALARAATYATHDGRGSSLDRPRQSTLPEAFECLELPSATVFCNRKLGSALCYIDSEHRTVNHLGYSITGPDLERLCTLSIGVEASGSTTHALVPVSQVMPLVRWESAFHLITVLCRIPVIARLVSWNARARLARPVGSARARFTRRCQVTADRLIVEDRINFSDRIRPGRIARLRSFPFHSPSALGGLADVSEASRTSPEEAIVENMFLRRWTVTVVDGRPIVSEVQS